MRSEHSHTATYDSDICDGVGAEASYFESNPGPALNLLGHRYYDPANGRFINRDPIGYGGGIDLYEYVEDNPDVLSDPAGLDPVTLPSDPSGLGPGWVQIPHGGGKGPTRWWNPDYRRGLEHHPGQSGARKWKGRDHWHVLRPKPGEPGWETDSEHCPVGSEVDLEQQQDSEIVGIGVGIVVVGVILAPEVTVPALILVTL
jgi:RHS repeat-associated protein